MMMTTAATRVMHTVVATAAVLAIGCSVDPPRSHDDVLGRPSLVAKDADGDLKHTVVAATLSQPQAPGTSLLWCSTFQLAWNELVSVMGPPVHVDGDPPIVELLNRAPQGRADLDSASFVAMAGFGRDGIIGAIRSRLNDTFGGAASPSMLPESIPPDRILAYTYLFKNLSFAHPFMRRTVPLVFNDKRLASFGLWSGGNLPNRSKIADQIIVHRYDSPTDWVVELKSTSAGDRLVLARLEPGGTLADTAACIVGSLVSEGAGGGDPGARPIQFGSDDVLIVPLLNFDITRSFHELIGREIVGTSTRGVIDEAMQNIRFRLDERGAVLKSEAAIGVVTSAPMPRDPKRMICDGPFAILMIRRGAAHPYFVAWVDNPELLVAWE
ncbi:MAG: hypothetical protein KF745_00150 [Phycisphaeraceae bacterium]|nr:hypothetical protein [Phycisphaeraceae bacterium]